MFALIHVLLHEHGLAKLDVPFLRDRTASPYLVGPDGLYLRDFVSGKPLVWDEVTGQAVAFDTPGTVLAVDGRYGVASAATVDADAARREYSDVEGATAYRMLVDHVARYTPEWAAGICDVPAATIRRIAGEYLEAASIGATIEIDGKTLAFRPVAVTLGKSVNNGWGAFECCWARTVLAALVGALENTGGTLGTTVRINRPRHNAVLNRIAGAKPASCSDGHFAALPEQFSLFRRRCLQHLGSAEPLAELDDLLLLPVEARFGPIHFDHQHGLGVRREAEMVGLFDGSQNPLVH